MRLFFVIFAMSFICANFCWADTVSYEAAARQVQKISFGFDKPRMIQAFSVGQRLSSEESASLVEVLESSELESIYVRHLMKIFSESELVALAEMMANPAYRVYLERMPVFAQSMMPEAMAYGRKAIPEAQRRAAEKRKFSAGSVQ